MIPMMNIVAWSNVVPWVDMRQVEQDLIISRAIVDLFSDAFLREQLRFRGGTALNKLISNADAIFGGHRPGADDERPCGSGSGARSRSA
jgi:hypothetical protein